ncbi:MAG: LptA/OstA family protein [Vicinamibacterales bacterium]
MRWQTLVRIGLAAALVGVSVLLLLQWRGREAPTSDGAGPTAPLPSADVVSEDEAGTLTLTGIDGKPLYEIVYGRMRVYADQRLEFEDSTTTFSRDGVPHTMKAPLSQMVGKAGPRGDQPERILFPKGVTLSAANGISIVSDGEATFLNNDQKVVIPGPMSFTRGRLSGSGVGADLYMDRSVLWILDQAKLSVAPEVEGGTPIEASATRIGLADADSYMVLEQNAVMMHQSQRLAADNARVSFAEAGDVVQYIELRGNSSVSSTDPASNKPRLTATNINLQFDPATGRPTQTRLAENALAELKDEGRVTAVRGSTIDIAVGPDGETVSRLEASAPTEVKLPRQGEQPARTITAQSLLAEGDNGGPLSRAVFTGDVDYRETRPAQRGEPASERHATSQSLMLQLNGDLADVEAATFRTDFKVVDGGLTATSDEARYDSGRETLQLRGRKSRPHVVEADVDITATEIDADLRNEGFEARGLGAERVQSVLMPQKRAGAQPGLFEAGKNVAGTSTSLSYSRTSRKAVYTGDVYLRQGDASLAAATVELDDHRGDLKASGKVASRLLVDTGDKASKEKPTEIDAAALVYSDAARTADYTGGAQLRAANGERLSGDRILLTLKPGERVLKTMEATAAPKGEVRIHLLEDHEAAGQKLVFDAATEMYRLTGTPAVLIVPAADRPGICSVHTGSTFTFSRTGKIGASTSEGGALGQARDAKCAEVRKR